VRWALSLTIEMLQFKYYMDIGGIMASSDYVNLYVDNSNIFLEGQRFAETIGENRAAFRIYFRNFIQLAVSGRKLNEVVWGGSIPPANDEVWHFLNEISVRPDLIPRSTSGENETVDHLIQLKMHRHVRKYRSSPGTVVLATGDGKGYYREDGFLYDVKGFLEDGWRIEIMSWDHSCHGELKNFAQAHGRFICLDNYYNSITFLQGGRIVAPLRTHNLS
jgi:hypothetical protein